MLKSWQIECLENLDGWQKFLSAEEEWITTAQKLAAENNGKLPTAAWLKKNGYCGLVLMLTRFPDKFKVWQHE